MTHKFCDKCGCRICFDGEREDNYKLGAEFKIRIDNKDGMPLHTFLEFCDSCFENFRDSLYSNWDGGNKNE